MQETGPSPWSVLGVAEGAPFSDVKRGFFVRARATHPDAPGGDAATFRQVQAAFDALRQAAPKGRMPTSTPGRATPYDEWLARPPASRQWSDGDPRCAGWGRPGSAFADALAVEVWRVQRVAA
ncbi:hypothetical protein K6U06_01520 [Acidiferrimicrobium sp. IK]|uniref:hypothetical protein n=1 Tax=Acidiferrimicrobium sp. IK TaxID=2871700 RepID=UPI0021CAEAC4|nr:hypothetical protein [Acidiferrimicrobium sp. IK]MCU4183023.1 hypothetical protein [Acidiferrimicrobium sp. IK]